MRSTTRTRCRHDRPRTATPRAPPQGARHHARVGGELWPGARAPGAETRPREAYARLGCVYATSGRQLSVLPSALRGADAQAAAPGRGRRLPRGDDRQPEQPRPGRRAGDERDGEGGRRRPGGDVRPARAEPRPPHLQRHDRQPRSAVGRTRAPSRQRDRPRRERALHARAHVRGARRRGARGLG